MDTRLVAVASVLALVAGGGGGAVVAQGGAGDRPSEAPPGLAGAWISEPDRMRLMTDLERSVWGEDATSVRLVELRIDPAGEAQLTVTRKIVDARDEPKPASVSVEAVRLRIGEARPATAGRLEHAVEVLEAERRYPDDPGYRWPLDGVRVRVVGFETDPSSIEIRFDTPEGRGSFWETLRREERIGLLTRHDGVAVVQ
jgi:hypothetical protein